MNNTQVSLTKLIEAADMIEEFLVGVSQEQFMKSELIRSAILHNLTRIGEAASRVDPNYQQQKGKLDWDELTGLKDLAFNEDFSVDWPQVWAAATQEVPIIRTQIIDIMKRDFPETI